MSNTDNILRLTTPLRDNLPTRPRGRVALHHALDLGDQFVQAIADLLRRSCEIASGYAKLFFFISHLDTGQGDILSTGTAFCPNIPRRRLLRNVLTSDLLDIMQGHPLVLPVIPLFKTLRDLDVRIRRFVAQLVGVSLRGRAIDEMLVVMYSQLENLNGATGGDPRGAVAAVIQ